MSDEPKVHYLDPFREITGLCGYMSRGWGYGFEGTTLVDWVTCKSCIRKLGANGGELTGHKHILGESPSDYVILRR
jgi:hypothetical protein